MLPSTFPTFAACLAYVAGAIGEDVAFGIQEDGGPLRHTVVVEAGPSWTIVKSGAASGLWYLEPEY